jgi:hypothetical protein
MLLFITIVLAIAIIVGIVLEEKGITYGGGGALAAISEILLAIFLLIWPLSYIGDVSTIQDYHALKYTVQESRNAEIDPLERATLTKSIIEINEWLARAQYWNGTFFDQAVPDEIMELEPIK